MRGSWRVFVAFRITRPFEFTIGEPRPRILLKRTFQTICHHEKLKKKTLRHGSAVFTDKHCLYRIAVVRYVDSLFYEPGDACRCHSRCYSLIVRELFGIGKNTFRHYLHYPSDRLTGVVIPRKLRELLRLYVILVKRLPATQVADCLHEFHCRKGQFPDTSHRHGRM